MLYRAYQGHCQKSWIFGHKVCDTSSSSNQQSDNRIITALHWKLQRICKVLQPINNRNELWKSYVHVFKTFYILKTIEWSCIWFYLNLVKYPCITTFCVLKPGWVNFTFVLSNRIKGWLHVWLLFSFKLNDKARYQ